MKYIDALCVFALSFGVVFCAVCFAYADERVSFANSPLWLSSAHVTEGKPIQISTVVRKSEAESAKGTVVFLADNVQVGSADFSLSNSETGEIVAVTFVPTKGTHSIAARISKVTVTSDGKEETFAVAQELKSEEKLLVDPDNDHDGIVDATDPDDDNDGVSDAEEKSNGTDPLKAEAKTAPSVLGASTASSDLVSKAKDMAGSAGASAFQATENVRLKGANYFDMKREEAEAAKHAKDESLKHVDATDELENAEGPSLPKVSQLKDSSGIIDTIKMQAYTAGRFLFGNIYAFYIILILLVLWILRTIWRRFSLN